MLTAQKAVNMTTDLDKEGKEPEDKTPRVSEEVCNDNVSQVSHSRFVQVKNSVVQFAATIFRTIDGKKAC